MRCILPSDQESRLWKLKIGRGEWPQSGDFYAYADQLISYDWCHLKWPANDTQAFDALRNTGIPWSLKNVQYLMESDFSNRPSPLRLSSEFNMKSVLPDAADDFKRILQELLISATSQNYTHPLLRLFYGTVPEHQAYESYYVHALSDPDCKTWLLYQLDLPVGMLQMRITAGYAQGLFYGVAPAYRGKHDLGRWILQFIGDYCRSHGLCFRSYVPVHNLPSIRAHIHEGIFPVSTWNNVHLFPLAQLKTEDSEYFKPCAVVPADALQGKTQSVWKRSPNIPLSRETEWMRSELASVWVARSYAADRDLTEIKYCL